MTAGHGPDAACRGWSQSRISSSGIDIWNQRKNNISWHTWKLHEIQNGNHKGSSIGMQPRLFVYLLLWLRWLRSCDSSWPTKPEIFPIWPFGEKVCQSAVWRFHERDCSIQVARPPAVPGGHCGAGCPVPCWERSLSTSHRGRRSSLNRFRSLVLPRKQGNSHLYWPKECSDEMG